MRVVMLAVTSLLSISALPKALGNGDENTWHWTTFGERGLTSKRDGTDDGEPLTGLMGKLLNSEAFPFGLGADTALKVKSREDLGRNTEKEFGFNINDREQRKTLAIKLYGVKSIDDLADLLDVPKESLSVFYKMMMKELPNIGGLTGAFKFLDVVRDFWKWADQKGFPDVPLKGLAPGEVEAKMTKWQKEIFAIAEGDENLVLWTQGAMNYLLPVQFSPAYVGPVLRGKGRSMAYDLCMTGESRQYFLRSSTPEQRKAIPDFMETIKKVLNEFDNMGLFSLA